VKSNLFFYFDAGVICVHGPIIIIIITLASWFFFCFVLFCVSIADECSAMFNTFSFLFFIILLCYYICFVVVLWGAIRKRVKNKARPNYSQLSSLTECFILNKKNQLQVSDYSNTLLLELMS
jgi:Ca2+/Na+ antiporter